MTALFMSDGSGGDNNRSRAMKKGQQSDGSSHTCMWLWSRLGAYSSTSSGSCVKHSLQCTYWGLIPVPKRAFHMGATTERGTVDEVGDFWLHFMS